MATALDLEVLPEVVALLDEFGRNATFDVRSKTYDETTGKTTYGLEPDVVAKCTPPWPYGTSFRQGDVAREGKAVIYVAGSGLAFEPTPGIGVTTDGLKWTVTSVQRISSGEQDAAWAMEIER